MVQLLKTVDFGLDLGDLSTVGHTLINTDGSIKQARTTTGIFEVPTAVGTYAAIINFDDDWQGLILWDTGEDEPVYASEDYNSAVDVVHAIEATGGKLDAIYQKLPEPTDNEIAGQQELARVSQILEGQPSGPGADYENYTRIFRRADEEIAFHNQYLTLLANGWILVEVDGNIYHFRKIG